MMLNSEIELQIEKLVSQKNYPCLAALKSFQRQEFCYKTYRDFGCVTQRKDLRQDLLYYLKEYLETKSPYVTFWAIYPETPQFDNSQEFNHFLQQELLALSSIDTKEIDRDPRFSQDPEDDNYGFSLWGHALAVVGLHPLESDPTRRFPFPALVFNIYDQFEYLAQAGLLDHSLKIKNGHYGSPHRIYNPFVDDAENSSPVSAIELASESKKCPFHFHSS